MLTGRPDWADDLAQQASLRAIERAASYRPGSHLDHWLFRIARNLWFNELRSRRVRQGGGLVPAEDAGLADPGPGAETNILVGQVLTMLNALPEAQRETALLVYAEGLTYREAAALMEVPVGTVMSRLATARARIAERTRETDGAAAPASAGRPGG